MNLSHVYIGVLVVLVASAAMLGARVEHWRDTRLVGVLALVVLTIVVAFVAGGLVAV